MGCFACGNGTTSVADRTSCQYNCQNLTFYAITAGSNASRSYDLSALGAWNITRSTAVNGTNQDVLIHGDLCSWDVGCIDFWNRPMNSYACYYNSSIGFPINMGKVASIRELPSQDGISFNFNQGSSFRFGRNLTCLTEIEVRCDPSVDVGAPDLSEHFHFDDFFQSCVLQLVWNTKYGCALCEEKDYAFYDRKCVDGKKERVWYWVTPFCNGGVSLPATQTLGCSAEVAVSVVAIVVVVVLGCVALAAAVAGGLFFWWKHKKLYRDYAMLKNTHLPLDDADPEPKFAIGESPSNDGSEHKHKELEDS